MESTQNGLSLPVAIVIAGALIAGAVIGTSGSGSRDTGVASQQQEALKKMDPITRDDYIRGNPNAPVKIVEYSDFECPFCKVFHNTMKQIVEEYDGEVAWVYRHFPLDQLHAKARIEAVAAECAGELGGNDAFWKYIDRFFEITPSNDRTDTATVLPQIAREIGLDRDAFAACLTSGRYDAHIEKEVQNAVATGGNGTPWSIVVQKNGKKLPLSGAQPYTVVKQIIDTALENKK